jgi:hypothetical protein
MPSSSSVVTSLLLDYGRVATASVGKTRPAALDMRDATAPLYGHFTEWATR